MKRIAVSILGLLLLLAVQLPTAAQTQQPAQKSLAASIGVYAYPGAGQTAATQSQDEQACYKSAVQTTGIDPSQLAQQSQQQAAASQQQAASAAPAQGSGAQGAARGAAKGALIGGIAGDAGTGAAVGAAAGAASGRRQSRQAQQQQAQATASNAQSNTAQQMDGFKRAFSACMEAKKYSVK